MKLSFKAAPPSNSDEESIDEEDELSNKRIKLIRELSEMEKPTELFSGGILISSEIESNKSSASSSVSVNEKRDRKEVEDLKRELDLKNTFSNETNRRDEDAEMNKYIEEQIRLRRAAAESRDKDLSSNSKTKDSELSDLYNIPSREAAEKVDDIILHTLSKNYSTTTDEKSEAMLSSQMLNGIPEVDLGLNERIRTIEATEEAKLRMASSRYTNSRSRSSAKSEAPSNYSCNFQHHRTKKYRDDNRKSRQESSDEPKTVIEPVVSIGEEPREVEVRLPSSGERKPPQKGRASDDYHLQKFKKHNRR